MSILKVLRVATDTTVPVTLGTDYLVENIGVNSIQVLHANCLFVIYPNQGRIFKNDPASLLAQTKDEGPIPWVVPADVTMDLDFVNDRFMTVNRTTGEVLIEESRTNHIKNTELPPQSPPVIIHKVTTFPFRLPDEVLKVISLFGGLPTEDTPPPMRVPVRIFNANLPPEGEKAFWRDNSSKSISNPGWWFTSKGALFLQPPTYWVKEDIFK